VAPPTRRNSGLDLDLLADKLAEITKRSYVNDMMMSLSCSEQSDSDLEDSDDEDLISN
jgi:hypothetical protein